MANREVNDITKEIRLSLDNHSFIAQGRLTRNWIHDVEVLPEYRRKGYGSRIMEDLIDLGGNILWVHKDNTPAIKLYEKFGFAIVLQNGDYYRMKLKEW